MTPEQARDQTMSVLDGTMAVSGVTGWVRDAGGQPLPQQCDEGGNQGVAFGHGGYSRAKSADPAADVQRVADYWSSIGIDPRIISEPVYVVFGSGGPVKNISFSTGPNYAISIGGICVPGDPFDYYDGLPTPPPPAP